MSACACVCARVKSWSSSYLCHKNPLHCQLLNPPVSGCKESKQLVELEPYTITHKHLKLLIETLQSIKANELGVLRPNSGSNGGGGSSGSDGGGIGLLC